MKALGITAMIFAIIAIFIPVIGVYLTIICALMAAFTAGPGLTFGAVTIGVNILNIVFLSPSLWLAAGFAEVEEAGTGDATLIGLGVFFVGIQVLATIILAFMHKKVSNKQAAQAV